MTLSLDYIPVSEIIPYKNNPRKNDKAVDIVANSIKQFGFKNPIILDKNNEIVAGHTRLKAFLKLREKYGDEFREMRKYIDDNGKEIEYEFVLNLKEVPVIWADDLTEEQVKAFRIMDNKSMEYSNWDWDLLKIEFESIKDLTFTGFTEAEIENVMDFQETNVEGKKEPKYQIQIGDLYQLGNHRIICGDSTKEETYLKLIPPGTNIQRVFTDPPYGVSYKGISNQGRKSPERGNNRNWNVIEGDDLRGEGLYDMLYECFKQVNQHLIKNGSIYVFHSSSNQIIFEKALNSAGFEVKQQLIWNKHHVLGRSHYHWCHEPLFYACRINESPLFMGTRTNRTILNTIDPENMSIEELKDLVKKIKEDSTMWDIKKDNSQEYIHPTQKPIRLAVRAIVNSSKRGDCILDPFAGSGSTLMACEAKDRKCYTIELDPVFCSHIIQRYEEETGKKAVKL